MSEERMHILKMLDEDKISSEEAERLLKAIEEPSRQKKGGGARDLFEEISGQVSQALNTVRTSGVGRAVDEAQKTGAGEWVSEMVDGLTGAVAEAVGMERAEVEEEEQTRLDAADIRGISAEASGYIDVECNEGEVEVCAVKKVKAPGREKAEEFAAQVQIHVERQGERIKVWREHPKPPFGVKLEVSYRIRCPQHLALELKTLNGQVKVAGGQGGVVATTVNGAVHLQDCAGSIEARSTNGKVQADIACLEEKGHFSSTNGKIAVRIASGQAALEARTLNGAIELALPAAYNGHLKAHTSNGQVSCAFPQAEEGEAKPKKNSIEGPIGLGGDDCVEAQTLNGNIAIEQA
jgi:hypothetical protein